MYTVLTACVIYIYIYIERERESGKLGYPWISFVQIAHFAANTVNRSRSSVLCSPELLCNPEWADPWAWTAGHQELLDHSITIHPPSRTCLTNIRRLCTKGSRLHFTAWRWITFQVILTQANTSSNTFWGDLPHPLLLSYPIPLQLVRRCDLK